MYAVHYTTKKCADSAEAIFVSGGGGAGGLGGWSGIPLCDMWSGTPLPPKPLEKEPGKIRWWYMVMLIFLLMGGGGMERY